MQKSTHGTPTRFQHYRINNHKAPIETKESEVIKQLHEKLPPDITNLRLVKKSLDARNKNQLYFIYAAEFESPTPILSSAYPQCEPLSKETSITECFIQSPRLSKSHRPIIVGTGPAGMMAALCLAQSGLNPIIIEQGGSVEERRQAVKNFWQKGELNEETNVQFGEGGAGTFSDGKLMTGIKKDQYTKKVLDEFINAGAPKEILYLAKPHIGTDNLVTMTQNIRKKIISLGGEYHFNTKLTDIHPNEDNTLTITTQSTASPSGKKSEFFTTNTLILALGHSARDTFKMLYERGVKMSQKPFSVGVRIEHKQSAINLAQYGKKYCHSPYLGAADYKLATHHENNRSLYTFCMCPGGVVVGATSLKEHVVTNGMSEFARNKENANAALLVNVDEKDFGSPHPLAGIAFQEMLEKRAYELGGKNYHAPVQTVKDLLAGRPTKKLGAVTPSYRPGVTPSDFRKLFPKAIYETLQKGIREMDKKLHGFATDEAVLTAVESRSSSPVRIYRDENHESNIKGLYPIGEGAGYAGGITSAAADGVKTAHKILTRP